MGLIAGYEKHELVEGALACFSQVGLNLPRCCTIISCVLEACGSKGILLLGEKIHTKAKKEGLMGQRYRSRV